LASPSGACPLNGGRWASRSRSRPFGSRAEPAAGR
jgi:hypothetical protein